MLKKSPGIETSGNSFRIEWDEECMATGFPEIDRQHKEWITMFNNFEKAIHQQKGTEVYAEALLFIIRYAETHFKFEEDLMEKYHSTGWQVNKAEHDKLRARIRDFSYMTWPVGATETDVLALEAELVDWLKHHICTVDVKLKDWVK